MFFHFKVYHLIKSYSFCISIRWCLYLLYPKDLNLLVEILWIVRLGGNVQGRVYELGSRLILRISILKRIYNLLLHVRERFISVRISYLSRLFQIFGWVNFYWRSKALRLLVTLPFILCKHIRPISETLLKQQIKRLTILSLVCVLTWFYHVLIVLN